MRTKIKLLLALFVLLFVGLLVRLFYWQIIEGSELSSQAKFQYNSSQVTKAPRGNIMASDGSFWALRENVWKVIADPEKLKDAPYTIAKEISPLVEGSDVGELTNLLSKRGSYIPLAQRINDSTKKSIEALSIPGISFEEQETRFYPEASAAAQLLGFVGKDESGQDVGYFGLEGYYNLPLSGKPGFTGREQDVRGIPILIDGTKQVPAIGGVDLVTSIDKRVQLLAEEKLKEGLEKYGAPSGSVTIMNPKTGEILALAALPSFDPANYQEYNNSLFKNPVVSNTFEPGSIFKVLVMASALDAGVVTPDTECDSCSGPLQVDKYTIRTWDNKYHPDTTMTNVIVESDNVGMAFVGKKLGADALYDYLNKFGIGQKTGVDLQGEVAPQMRPKGTWNIVDLATTTFGQGIAVTGIEMVRATAVIANGGYLVTPHVVTSLKGDGWQENVKIPSPRRIIGEKAAGEMAQMMVAAANLGEAKWTKIPGYNIAGKTGTAQIPVAGHYDPTNTNHSFIGFAPAVNPKFIMLVNLQSPQSSPWAAETAAPLWYSIARDLFPYFGIQPEE